MHRNVARTSGAADAPDPGSVAGGGLRGRREWSAETSDAHAREASAGGDGEVGERVGRAVDTEAARAEHEAVAGYVEGEAVHPKPRTIAEREPAPGGRAIAQYHGAGTLVDDQ